MANQVKVKLTGAKRTQRRMTKVARKFKDFESANLAAAIALRRWIDLNFKAEGARHENSFGPWKPLHPVTIEKRRQGKGSGTAKILQDTGALRSRWEVRANRSFGEVESRQDYSRIHENGGIAMIDGRTVKVPRRKILPGVGQTKKIALKAYQGFVDKVVVKGLK